MPVGRAKWGYEEINLDPAFPAGVDYALVGILFS